VSRHGRGKDPGTRRAEHRTSARLKAEAQARPRPGLVRDLAALWTRVAGGIATTLLTWVVGILAGMQPLPGTVPFVNLVRQHEIPVLGAATVVFVLTFVAWAASRKPASEAVDAASSGARSGALLPIAVGVATFSTVAWALTITMVLAQPDWCPQALCVQPPGPHDRNLETELTALQTATYTIAGDPSGYSLGRLPATSLQAAVAAQRTTTQGAFATPPYRVVVRVHDLQRGEMGMFIEGVSLLLRQVRPVPNPLQVWLHGAPLDYQANPFRARYTGQPVNSTIASTYAGRVAQGHVQLAPGESDELSITVDSTAAADVRFQVAITYRVASDLKVQTLTLPPLLEVVFSDDLNWHQYRLQDGRFLPA
jgi:hypothetical protein